MSGCRRKRVTGALVIVAGLVVIGGEAITTIGVHGVAGDLLFVLAGTFFATFGMFLRKWRVVADARHDRHQRRCRSPSCRSTECWSGSTA